MLISEFERQRRRRAAQWDRVNAAIGVGALAFTVVLLLLVGYSLATDPGGISAWVERLVFGIEAGR